MKLIREYLDILFRKVQPEILIANLNQQYEGSETRMTVCLDSQNISQEAFHHYSYMNLGKYSPDEIENFYYDMQNNYMEVEGSRLKTSVFNVIPHYMRNVVNTSGEVPKCRFQEILNWRSTSLKLGQDTLLMSYLAYEDHKNRCVRNFFAWNSAIDSDNVRLQHILEKGIAENHFHLYGSTQSFPLSWICLMNHPRKIAEYFKVQGKDKHMAENLNENFSLGVVDNQMTWTERISLACWIRKELFKNLKQINSKGNGHIGKELIAFAQFPEMVKLTDEVDALRYSYGYKFKQPDFHEGVCLDYAIDCIEDKKGKYRYNASLTGERRFLYQCFYQCYSGEFTKTQQDVFYLYLLIKAQLRSELIQVNQRVGFRNFARYQDRKSDFWGGVKEYEYEAHVLAVNASLKGENIQSLEARITPSTTWTGDVERVLLIDRDVDFAKEMKSTSDRGTSPNNEFTIKKNGTDSEYYFVIHFIKQKLSPVQNDSDNQHIIGLPRNSDVRANAEIQARALKKAISNNEYYAGRIGGIDACSTEIGCRPETFATEFRYLRCSIRSDRELVFWEGKSRQKHLKFTYHVGEDFLDIADGLRAIDEAVFFLKMERGDRLGHALALGVDPELHYTLKRKLSTMPKQDLLDNYTWLLFRSLELGVEMDSQMRSKMEFEAENLLHYIYPPENSNHFTLKDYFESWKLRGDHPNLYRSGRFQKSQMLYTDAYDRAKELENDKLNLFREQLPIARLYYRYQFGSDERRRGQEIQNVTVTDTYIEFIRTMQKSMQKLLANKGIAIECNPSSNVLIGTFQRYDCHPILKFNNYALGNENRKDPVQLNVSINTDDQGVFDTLLENEYALMACALGKMTDENGEKLYSEDMVYDYLDHVRQMGTEQVFKRNEFE